MLSTSAGASAGLRSNCHQTKSRQGPRATRTVSVAPDDAETRTPLFLLRTGNDAAKSGEFKPVVALGRPVGGKNKADTQGTIQGILERELIRAGTLDRRPGRAGPADTRPDPRRDRARPRSRATRMPSRSRSRSSSDPAECRALVRRGEGENATILQKHDLGTNPDAGNYSVKLTATAETLSRTEFPALLKQLGATGSPNRVRDDAPVPPDVDKRLETLSMVETFAAVRALHEAIRATASRLRDWPHWPGPMRSSGC